MNDDEAVTWECRGGFREEFADFGFVPIVEDIRPQMDVVILRKLCVENVSGDDLDAVVAAMLRNGLGGDAVYRWTFEDGGGDVGVAGDQGAGVDAAATGEIEDAFVLGEIETFRERGAEKHSAAIHCSGEMRGEIWACHCFRPGLRIVAAPIGGLAGFEHRQHVERRLPIFHRRVVGGEVVGRGSDEVLPSAEGKVKDAAAFCDEALGRE